MSESRTPRAVWKAAEAEFFLGHLRTSTPSLQPFTFFLSAFLNAAYSSREILRREAIQDNALSREGFDDWESTWEAALSTTDAKVWKLGLMLVVRKLIFAARRLCRCQDSSWRSCNRSGVVAFTAAS
jgi:hypothetical protein